MPSNSAPTPPQSIAIILDGNRRWAKQHGKTTPEGHRAGLEKIKEVLQWSQEAGVKEITFYVFSTENWNRTQEEVAHFMKLAEYAFDTWIEDIIKKDVQIRIIGERDRLPESVRERAERAEERTKGCKNGTIALALSYGGRSEILSAVNKLLIEGREVVTEDELRSAMWSEGMRDPDLIIRTGGEKRLSNFLTWQSTYSELFFIDTMWPAFSKEEFIAILSEFSIRDRRVGR